MESLLNYAWDEDYAFARALGSKAMIIKRRNDGAFFEAEPMCAPVSEEELSDLREVLGGMKTSSFLSRMPLISSVEQLIERITGEQGFLANCQYLRIAAACGATQAGVIASPPEVESCPFPACRPAIPPELLLRSGLYHVEQKTCLEPFFRSCM